MMNEPGTTVFVRWYGKIVPGEVIDRKGHCDWPPFAEWIPIRMTIPNSEGDPIVPGVRNICMYHMNHVYASAEEAQQAEADFQQKPVATVPAAPPSADAPTVSDGFRPFPTSSDRFRLLHQDQSLRGMAGYPEVQGRALGPGAQPPAH